MYKKYKELAHMVCLTKPISQPSLNTSPFWIPFIINEVIKEITMTDYPVVFMFKFCGLSFHSADGASGKHLIGFTILQSFLYVLGTWLIG
jgi:DNA modification methylase